MWKMDTTENSQTKSTARIIGDAIKDIGSKTVAELAVEAATKLAAKKVTDKNVRARLRTAGKVARVVGKNLEKNFQDKDED